MHTSPSPHAQGRDADYDRIVDDLSYRYANTFTRERVQEMVNAARVALEPVATIPTFLPVLVERFARDQLLAAAQASGHAATSVPELLFVCVHNAGRSQMAAALAQHLSAGRVHVRSAGSAPSGGGILPTAIRALAERGIQVSRGIPQAPHRRCAARRRHHRDDGLWRRLPDPSRQALPRLGRHRPGWAAHRSRPTDPRRHPRPRHQPPGRRPRQPQVTQGERSNRQ